MSLKEINDSQLTEALNTQGLSFFYAYAAWCGTCRFFAPKVEKLANEQTDVSFFKIDAEENKEFSGKVSMDNLPFIACFHNGQYIGGKSTSKIETIENMINMAKEKLA